MFPSPSKSPASKFSFPRIRGDVPAECASVEELCEVFPAYAGMFRVSGSKESPAKGFPRIRGDVPISSIEDHASSTFSPHTRGCSSSDPTGMRDQGVFPAYAGMFRHEYIHWLVRQPFSPHTRGCSAAPPPPPEAAPVFPAYAGMFRADHRMVDYDLSFPRIRGDVPKFIVTGYGHGGFSPHTRGCSCDLTLAEQLRTVFPAYAGMFRVLQNASSAKKSFPRIRGDVPKPKRIKPLRLKFSPHTRGCSEKGGDDASY